MTTLEAQSPPSDPRLAASEELADHVERYLCHGDHKWDLKVALEKYKLASESLTSSM